MKSTAQTKQSTTQEKLEQIQMANIQGHFNSTGMNQTQAMVYLLEESQNLITDFGIEIEFAKAIQELVKYRTPFNIIKKIMYYVRWSDDAETYDTMKIFDSEQITIQELVEQLKHYDPNTPVVLGDLCSAVPLKSQPTEMYMVKDGSSDKVIFKDDFQPILNDKMQQVVVIDTPTKRQESDKISSHTLCFSNSNADEQETIKWLFKNAQKLLKDNNVNIMPLKKKAKDLKSALEILGTYVDLVEVTC